LAGHQQVTDAYLLGLAMHKKGKLATMDRAVRALLPDKNLESGFLILI
jgi:predicted nucleic acid-binding protein